VDGTGSESCPMDSFGMRGAELSITTNVVLVRDSQTSTEAERIMNPSCYSI
jgi:hypothetical protein